MSFKTNSATSLSAAIATTYTVSLDTVEFLQENPQVLADNLIQVAAWVNATTYATFTNFSKIEDPFQFDEVAACLYSLKILDELNSSFQRVDIHDSLKIVRGILRITTEHSKNLVKCAREELLKTRIVIYHV